MLNTKMTRNCFDPWEYIEFRSDGRIAPCCGRESFTETFTDLIAYRNNSEYKQLRTQLMDGDLDFKCSTCPFREKISVKKYKKALHSRYPQQKDLLTPPLHMDMARIDFTEKCNLRCTYCAASQPNYVGWESGTTSIKGGREMPIEQLEKVVQALVDFKNIDEIAVNGHGETTTYKRWDEYCTRLQEFGLKLTITSNFSRKFNDREIAVFSRFKSIAISIDTDDPVMLKKIRRKVNLGDILVNMTKIRAKSMADGGTSPDFIFLSGIYDKNITRLPNFAWFAVACGVKEISFWKFVKHPDVPGIENIYPLISLDREDLLQAYDNMKRTEQILTSNRVRAVFTGGIMEDIREQCNEFITMSITDKKNDGAFMLVSVKIEPFLINKKESFHIYLAYEKEETIYFLHRKRNEFYSWDRESEPLSYGTISRIPQEMSVSFPLRELLPNTVTAFYIGFGKNISEVLEKRNYVVV